MYLSDLKTGESAIIVKVLGHGGFRRRILEMGFVRGKEVTVLLNAPLKDPIKYKILNYEVSLRRSEAALVEVVTEAEAREHICGSGEEAGSEPQQRFLEEAANRKYKEINLALVGNPNSGKTSLFNALSGGHERVGNYGGVTVDAKSGHFHYKGYRINITDLPGTYALSAYSPEEIYVRRHLMQRPPDVILNAVVSSNLERNLYLTTELIDINPRMVVALNMYDELTESGARLDYKHLAKMLGVPMIPVIARSGKGLDKLLDAVLDVYENRNDIVRHIHIPYSAPLETEIAGLSKLMKSGEVDLPSQFPPRYWAMKLLEGDKESEKNLESRPHFREWSAYRDAAVQRIRKQLGEDAETALTDEKYGFIAGALRETYTPGEKEQNKITSAIDTIVTHKLFSFPIFLALIWIMFNATFSLGAYPQEWIESLIGFISEKISALPLDGPLNDLLVNGIIGGVGSVIVFLPNILILYLFISLMEDSGYMARAAFIMDRIMHKIGLHGKSFIPLIMGFGCNVPAIMSARTIESRSSRIITIFINPFMSCSARLPVYILLAGTFFPRNSGLALMLLYLLGILVAVVTARALRKFLFKADDTPFVMELPPYRVPTVHAALAHMWEKCAQYLKKIGSVILAASILIWFLNYYPRPDSRTAGDEAANLRTEQLAPEPERTGADGNDSRIESNTGMPLPGRSPEAIPADPSYGGTYLERLGKWSEPVMRPLGLHWQAGVALLSGAAAKEIIVSTLGVLTPAGPAGLSESPGPADPAGTPGEASPGGKLSEEDAETALSVRLIRSGAFTPASAVAFMVFVLLYFPCIATLIAIAHETGSWKWAVASLVYNTAVAWICAFIAYNLCKLF